MERRIYFIAGDVLTNLAAGIFGAWLAWLAVSGDWSMLMAMVVGMIIGMAAGSFCGIFFTPLFGSMELMLPASLSGMLGGMTVAMLHIMIGISAAYAAWCGGAAGLLSLAFTYILQARLHVEAE